MKKHKLLTHLKSWPLTQLENFLAYLLFFYPKKKDEIRYLDYIVEALKNKQSQELNPQRIHVAIFKGKSASRISNIQSNLFKLIPEYMATVEVKSQNEMQKKRVEMKYMSQQGMDKEKILMYWNRETQFRIDKIPNAPLQHYQFLEELYFHDVLKDKYAQKDSFLKLSQLFDFTITCKRLGLYMESLNRRRLFNDGSFYEVHLEDYLAYLKEDIPLVKCYSKMIETFHYPSLYFLLKAKEEVFKSIDAIPSQIANNFLINLQNRFYIQFRNRVITYQRAVDEMFEIIKLRVEKGWIQENGIISVGTFANVLEIALNAKRMVWYHTFLTTELSKVDKKYRQDLKLFAEANEFYHESHFTKAYPLLMQIKIKESNLDLRSRCMALICLYEISNADEGENEDNIKNTIRSVNRKLNVMSISNNKVLAFKNFINLFNRLHRAKQQKEILETQIKTLSPLVFSAWLKTKIDSYAPRY